MARADALRQDVGATSGRPRFLQRGSFRKFVCGWRNGPPRAGALVISRSTVGSVGLRLPHTLSVPTGLTTCGPPGLKSPLVAVCASRPPAWPRHVPTPKSGIPTSTGPRLAESQPTVQGPDWPVGWLPPHLRLKLRR